MPDLFGEIEPGVAEVVPFDGGARAYSYSVPAALKEVRKVGQRVRVPVGGRTSIGVVWKYPAEPPPAAVCAPQCAAFRRPRPPSSLAGPHGAKRSPTGRRLRGEVTPAPGP